MIGLLRHFLSLFSAWFAIYTVIDANLRPILPKDTAQAVFSPKPVLPPNHKIRNRRTHQKYDRHHHPDHSRYCVSRCGHCHRFSVSQERCRKGDGSAETEATRIINEAIKAGETKKRESILEAKDEIHKQRAEADRELKERRNETQQLERRLIQREEALDKKSDTLDRKNEELTRQLEATQKEKEELSRIKAEQLEKLEQIASMTRDEAREMLVASIESEATHDAAVKLREIQQKLKDESEQTAREIISTAIQLRRRPCFRSDRFGRTAAQR